MLDVSSVGVDLLPHNLDRRKRSHQGRPSHPQTGELGSCGGKEATAKTEKQALLSIHPDLSTEPCQLASQPSG